MGRDRFRFQFVEPPSSAPALERLAAPEGAPGPGLAMADLAGASASESMLIRPHEPRLTPRDEVVYLLHAAAEVEHALMAQYLYAAYSLNAATAPAGWASTILQIAREEMAHLASVQNLLRLIGGPINFDRQDFPFRSDLYPFPFRLEPLTLRSLAKYIAAERPAVIADPSIDLLYRTTIEPLAKEGNDEAPVNRVGALYLRLRYFFGDPDAVSAGMSGDQPLANEDFRLDSGPYFATEGEWAFFEGMLIGPPPESLSDAETARTAAIRILKGIAEQGEGYDSPSGERSHFDLFVELFQAYRANFPNAASDDVGPSTPAIPVPRDPSTAIGDGPSVISDPKSRGWAQLLNVRYRMLLQLLSHYFTTANAEARGQVTSWILEEMRPNLARISAKLTSLPRRSDGLPDRAGPPFELPYTLELPDPDRPAERWRTHRDSVAEAAVLIANLQMLETQAGNPADSFLTALQGRDLNRKTILDQLMNDNANPPSPPAPSPQTAAKENMLKLVAFLKASPHNAANRHGGVDLGNGQTLADLFADPEALLNHLTTTNVVSDGVELGQRLLVPGDPDGSAFFRIIQRAGHPMKNRFALAVPDTKPDPSAADLTGVQIVKAWIETMSASG